MLKNSSATGKKIDIVSRGFARMLSSEVRQKLAHFHLRHSMQAGGCLMRYNDCGPRADNPPVIPYAPFHRSRIYTGTRETGSFNHHSQLTKFKGKYYFAWSNGLADEEAAGQRILISHSQDARNWSEPVLVAADDPSSGIAHNCLALGPTEDRLYIVDKKEDTIKDAQVTGMRRIDPDTTELSVYCSSDGLKWTETFTFSEELEWIFEFPRLTTDGHMLCAAATKSGPALLRWPGADICEQPETISIPEPVGTSFPYGESTWYQTDDGTIVVFWRDEGMSCRVWVNYSTDNGQSFSEPVISDIPDSMSRLYAGKLNDGRHYLCNNAFPTLLNRIHLMLLLSDNGYEFNKVFILVDDPTAQRLAGLLKEDGYQYPCCLPCGNKLLVGYSVNKEDVECGIVDSSQI